MPPALSEAFRTLLAGLALGLAFNPVTAVVGSAAAAVLGTVLSRRGGRSAWWLAVAVGAWAVGDGAGVFVQASALARGVSRLLGTAPPVWASVLFVGAWVLGGLAFGYLVPAGFGVAVGRRVTFGTGRRAAAAVAVTLCLAILAAVPTVAGALLKVTAR